MLFHQTEGVAAPAKAIDKVGEPLKQQGAIPIIRNHVASSIAATRDMVDGTGIFKANGRAMVAHHSSAYVRL